METSDLSQPWLISSSFPPSCFCYWKLGKREKESPGDQSIHFPFPRKTHRGWGASGVAKEAPGKTFVYALTCKEPGWLPHPHLVLLSAEGCIKFHPWNFILNFNSCLSFNIFVLLDFGKAVERIWVSRTTERKNHRIQQNWERERDEGSCHGVRGTGRKWEEVWWRHGRWVEMKGDEMKMRGDEIELGKEMRKSNCLFSCFA